MDCHIEQIRTLMTDRDLSQRKLSMELGIPPSTFSNYMTGANELPLDLLSRLADYFEVTTDFLLGRAVDRKPMLLISPAEQEMLMDYRGLDANQREMVRRTIQLFREQNRREPADNG